MKMQNGLSNVILIGMLVRTYLHVTVSSFQNKTMLTSQLRRGHYRLMLMYVVIYLS